MSCTSTACYWRLLVVCPPSHHPSMLGGTEACMMGRVGRDAQWDGRRSKRASVEVVDESMSGERETEENGRDAIMWRDGRNKKPKERV